MFIQILVIMSLNSLLTRWDLRSISFRLITWGLSIFVSMVNNIWGVYRREKGWLMRDLSWRWVYFRSVIIHFWGVSSDSIAFSTSLLTKQVIVPYLLVQHRSVLSSLLFFKYFFTIISWKNHLKFFSWRFIILLIWIILINSFNLSK